MQKNESGFQEIKVPWKFKRECDAAVSVDVFTNLVANRDASEYTHQQRDSKHPATVMCNGVCQVYIFIEPKNHEGVIQCFQTASDHDWKNPVTVL